MISKIIHKLTSILIMVSYLIHLRKRRGTLLYLGVNRGISLSTIFYRYKKVYGFEANPNFFKTWRIRLLNLWPNCMIYNIACSDRNGTVKFNITDHDGEASSIGVLKKINGVISKKVIKTITIPCINLMNFLQQHDIDFIDDYISDIEGCDLQVLKSIKTFIDQRKIGTIICETTKDKYGTNRFEGLPNNNFTGFKNLLSKNYECIAKGNSKMNCILQDNVWDETPDSWWLFDCKWRLKS